MNKIKNFFSKAQNKANELVTCLHTMLEICAHSGGLPIRYKVII